MILISADLKELKRFLPNYEAFELQEIITYGNEATKTGNSHIYAEWEFENMKLNSDSGTSSPNAAKPNVASSA